MEPPRQVPTPALMRCAESQRPSNANGLVISPFFLIMRYTGMRRRVGRYASGATSRRQLGLAAGTRQRRTDAGHSVARSVMTYLHTYVERLTGTVVRSGRRRRCSGLCGTADHRERVEHQWQGKNIWRLCKTYGGSLGIPMLKPHDLRHGVAMEVLEQQRWLPVGWTV